MKATCVRLNACIWLCCLLCFCCIELKAKELSFLLECPKSVTVYCYDDLSNLDKWGTAIIWKNNKKTPIPPNKVVYNTNACGIGTIIRFWEVEDPYWNIHKCQQIITIIGGTAFGLLDITWPPNYTTEGCNPSTDPRTLPAPYDYPKFNKLKCSQPMYSYKDSKFTVSDGCMKILRDWKVIDWCQYKPNTYPSVGVWTYTQVIKLIVTDSTAKLICPADTIVESKIDCKSTFVKLDSAKAVSKCGFPLNIRNTSPYSISKGANASGNYPVGVTEFYFIAEYGCGKEIKCKVRVTVKSKIGPVPYCYNGLITTLMPIDTNRDGTADIGMIEIWAKDFNLGSYHPCGYKQLKFSFSSDTTFKSKIFTCADLGKNEIEMWVTDSLGNQSFCKTFLDVQNNGGNIPDCKRKDSIQTIIVSGQISNDQAQLIPDVMMNLSSNGNTQVVINTDTVIGFRFDTIISKSGLRFFVKRNDTSYVVTYDTIQNKASTVLPSDLNGKYLFNKLNKNQNYSLDAVKRETTFKGININDVIVLLKHVNGTVLIKDPYKLIAADINCDNKIDNKDFEMLYAVVNGTGSYALWTKHWRFVLKSIVFPNPLNPFTLAFDAPIDFIKISEPKVNVDYMAIRIGELDGLTTIINEPVITSRNAGNKNQLDESFSLEEVFPNPISGPAIYLNLSIYKSSNLSIQWYDAQGKLLQNNSRSFDKGRYVWEQLIDVPQVPGIFFYRISDGKKSVSGKLLYSK